MSLSEMKARFRGYRRREEERDEARIMEHNRTASELFTSESVMNRSEGGVSDRVVRKERKCER